MNWDKRIRDRDITVGVVGLGYVGLPLALAFAESGFSVIGFDNNAEKVETIQNGESTIPDIDDQRLSAVIDESRLTATTSMERMSEVNTLSICVPTPLRKSRDPDISYIAEATQTIADYFEPPGIIVLESTTYPGTTEEILNEKFQSVGWDLDNDVHLAFSPERIDPSNETYTIENTPKVVGGLTDRAGELASILYGSIVDEVVTVSNTRAAEMVKLLENTFRSINIGLANEMALICDRLDIDVWEVIDAAATKPYGFMPFYPGPGLGGHCIPVDPLFLSWKARLADTQSRFVELADEINRSMPKHVVSKVTEGLNDDRKPVNGSEICVLGVAYKSNVNDVRESPAHQIINLLRDRGAELTFCDPYVDEFTVEGDPVPRIDQDELDTRSFDIGVIVTNHDKFNWNRIVGSFPALVDSRNALDDGVQVDTTRVLTL
jgi:UDP-N-acetyl-D-glucosamine dehydrogenase